MKITENQLRRIIRESIKGAIYNSYDKPNVKVFVRMPNSGMSTKSDELLSNEIVRLYRQIPEEEKIPFNKINFSVFQGVHANSREIWCMLVNVLVCLCDTPQDVETILDRVITFGGERALPFHTEVRMQKGRKFKGVDAGPEYDIEKNVQFIIADIYSDLESRKRLHDIGWPSGQIKILIYDDADSREVNFHEMR